jgi:hypothetical protein
VPVNDRRVSNTSRFEEFSSPLTTSDFNRRAKHSFLNEISTGTGAFERIALSDLPGNL